MHGEVRLCGNRRRHHRCDRRSHSRLSHCMTCRMTSRMTNARAASPQRSALGDHVFVFEFGAPVPELFQLEPLCFAILTLIEVARPATA